MGRPKGSKNKKPAACHQPRVKSQFANTAMANQLHADFCAGRGVYSYDALHSKYQTLFDKEYFCLAPFETVWKKLLKKVLEVHGVDYHTKHVNVVKARTAPRPNRYKRTNDF